MEIKDLLELFMELIPAFVLKPVTSPNSDFTCLTSVEVYIWLYLPPQILLG